MWFMACLWWQNNSRQFLFSRFFEFFISHAFLCINATIKKIIYLSLNSQFHHVSWKHHGDTVTWPGVWLASGGHWFSCIVECFVWLSCEKQGTASHPTGGPYSISRSLCGYYNLDTWILVYLCWFLLPFYWHLMNSEHF